MQERNLDVIKLTRVNAGFPGAKEDLIENSLDLNRYVIVHPASTFFMRVDGDSMIHVGILSGDIVAVDRSIKPSNNCIIVAVLDEKLLIKRWRIVGNKKFLISENHNYPSLRVDCRDDFEIWGTVTHVIRSIL